MEITEIECKILRIKAGAILILGMQLGSELQLDTEEKREDLRLLSSLFYYTKRRKKLWI